MRVRLALPAEVDDVMGIIDDGRSRLKAIGIDQWQGACPSRENVESDISTGESFVLIDEEGLLVAVATISSAGKREYDSIQGGSWLTESSSEGSAYVTVHRLAVSGDFKGRGVASRLLHEAETIAASLGKESVRIDTHPGNEPMRRLLVKMGYAECGIVHASHVSDGVVERVAYEKKIG